MRLFMALGRLQADLLRLACWLERRQTKQSREHMDRLDRLERMAIQIAVRQIEIEEKLIHRTPSR